MPRPAEASPHAAHPAPDSEFAFLTLLERHFPQQHPRLLLGRGDDCALMAVPERILISTDILLEDVHFRRSYFPPEAIGHKALAANLSDIAGMGGTALGFCLALQAPWGHPELDERFWDRLCAGMAALAARWEVPLVGGDLSRAPGLGLTITVWGQSPRPLLRGDCRPDDLLFVCDAAAGPDAVLPLGLARCGLLALESLGSEATQRYPTATAAHLFPTPGLEAAPLLSAQPGVHSLMDLSDGLARDLPRLLGAETTPQLGRKSTLGAALDLDPALLHPELLAFCAATGREPLREALLGGEEYCLLGTCSPTAAAALAPQCPGFRVLGRVTTAPDLTCNGRDLADLAGPGFDHFQGGAQP